MRDDSQAPLGVADLRADFDRSFSEPADPDDDTGDAVLAVVANTGRFALRLADLSHVERMRTIEPLPGGPHGLVGLVGIRGRVVPVYSLAELLGCPGGADRWLALCGRGDDVVALSFSELEGHARIPRAQAPAGREAHALVRIGGAHRALVNVAFLIAQIEQRAGVRTKE